MEDSNNVYNKGESYMSNLPSILETLKISVEPKNMFQQPRNPNPLPMNSITSNVSVGNIIAGSDLERLSKNGFGGIVACVPSLPRRPESYKKHGLKVEHVSINDVPSADIMKHFDSAIAFINSITKSEDKHKNRVLIHCHAGISRSATICCVYLCRTFGMTVSQAIEYMGKHRIIQPNIGFKKQMMEYFKMRGQKSTAK